MSKRTEDFAKDLDYEAVLRSANDAVASFGEDRSPDRPMLFVMGPPRSGTTLTYQLLAASGGFHYPSNLVARFYRSPAWGARMQRLLEPLLERGPMSFTSRAGNTEHWWGPHEFGYFWAEHFDFSAHHEPDAGELDGLVGALGAFEAEDERPMLFKNNVLCLVAAQLMDALPTARFLWVRRPALHVADSLYRTRIRFHGDAGTWWSTRPCDVDPSWSVAEQIAVQVHRCESALATARDQAPDRWVEVDYARVCSEPHEVAREAADWMEASAKLDELPRSFPESAETRAPAEIVAALEQALRR